MVLIAIDKRNRPILGYLCKNEQSAELLYCCSVCDIEFSKPSELEEHMLLHATVENSNEQLVEALADEDEQPIDILVENDERLVEALAEDYEQQIDKLVESDERLVEALAEVDEQQISELVENDEQLVEVLAEDYEQQIEKLVESDERLVEALIEKDEQKIEKSVESHDQRAEVSSKEDEEDELPISKLVESDEQRVEELAEKDEQPIDKPVDSDEQKIDASIESKENDRNTEPMGTENNQETVELNESNINVDDLVPSMLLESDELVKRYHLVKCAVKLVRLDLNSKNLSNIRIARVNDGVSEENTQSISENRRNKTESKEPSPFKVPTPITRPRKIRRLMSPNDSGNNIEQTFPCNYCSKSFKKMYKLNLHMDTHLQFVCFLCGKKYAVKKELVDHERVVHQSNNVMSPVIPCHVCGKNVSNMKKHMRRHENEQPNMSSELDKTEAIETVVKNEVFGYVNNAHASEQFVEEYLESAMEPKKEEIDVPSGNDLQYNDTFNGFELSTSENVILEEVELLKSDTNVYPMEDAVASAIPMPRKSKAFRCPLCPKRFSKEILLTKHVANHERKRIPCKICGKGLTPRYMYTHKKKYHSQLT